MATAEFTWEDEEFDDTFYQEVDKLEELATSLTQHHHHHHHLPPPPPPPPPQILVAGSVSYSPPRELSQRFPAANNNDNNNNDDNSNMSSSTRSPSAQEHLQLKSELSRVSKQLLDLKQECAELRKERDKEQLKFVHSNTKANTCDSEAFLQEPSRNGVHRRCDNVNAAVPVIENRCIGIQTDKDDESVSGSIHGATSMYSDIPKLLSIWSSRSIHRSRRNFIAKLFETCATDFCMLFGCLGVNMTSKMELECRTHVPLPADIVGLRHGEVARLSQLYSVLTKLSDDMVHVNAFVEVLLDLCSLENALVVRRSLRILHIALDHLSSIDRPHHRSVLCSGIMSRWRGVTLG